MKLELLKNYNKSYDVEFVQYFFFFFQIVVLVVRKLDIGWFDWLNMGLVVINGGLDLKIIVDLNQDKVFYWLNCYVVLESLFYKSLVDFKGKIIGVGVFGVILDFVVWEIMRKYGFEYFKDYNMIEVKFFMMEVMLRDGKIDCGNFLNFFWYKVQEKGGLRVFFIYWDVFDFGQEIMYVV